MTKRPSPDALHPRKAPRQSRSAVTVETVVEAATRVLERDGFEGYNTNAIAKLAGVSIGSLYQYFPNKDGITRAIIEREVGALVGAIEAITSQADGREALSRIIYLAAERKLSRPALSRLIDIEEQRIPLGDLLDRTRISVEAGIRACLETGDLGPEARRAAIATDLVAMIKGLVDSAGLRGETNIADLNARVRHAVFGYLESIATEASDEASGVSETTIEEADTDCEMRRHPPDPTPLGPSV